MTPMNLKKRSQCRVVRGIKIGDRSLQKRSQRRATDRVTSQQLLRAKIQAGQRLTAVSCSKCDTCAFHAERFGKLLDQKRLIGNVI